MAEEATRFDYVIVGAGSAGCALASRLSEDPTIKVALLEAGPRDNSLMVRMPAGVGSIIPRKGAYNWGFWTAPQKHLNDRKLWWPRGRGWGGSSSINGMIYIRGHARDYDQWRQMGLTGWGYRDVLPYFKRSEHNEEGADAWRGQGGPLWVSKGAPGNPIYKAFVQAGAAAGYPVTRDFNGGQQEGMGPYHLTIKQGERCSSSFAYLHPALQRPNLTVFSNARATRVIIENGVAKGVEYAVDRDARRIFADREVLLCLGAVQSPHLLQLSGIGPADHLKQHGLAVVLDQPEVGANLQDHLDVSLVYECTKPITVYSQTKGFGVAAVGLRYLLNKEGPGRSNHLESGAFLKTRGELDRPDIQLHLVNAPMIDHGKVRVKMDAFTVHACQLRPESKGEVRLASADPLADPLIDPNYLATELDRRTMRDSVRIVRDIVGRPPLNVYRGGEYSPGANVVGDADVDAWIRQSAETIYHPVGTVRMGVDSKAPLDGELRLRGIAQLRVIDASVMPTLIGGNTNAPTIMIAEKASDMILGKAPLAPDDAPIAEDEPSRAA